MLPLLVGTEEPKDVPAAIDPEVAAATQEQQALDTGAERFVDDVGFDHQVLVDEIRRECVIGMNTTDAGSGQHDIIHWGLFEKLLHRMLIGQIQGSMGAGDNVFKTCFLQAALHGGTHHAAMAGNKDAHIFIHHPDNLSDGFIRCAA